MARSLRHCRRSSFETWRRGSASALRALGPRPRAELVASFAPHVYTWRRRVAAGGAFALRRSVTLRRRVLAVPLPSLGDDHRGVPRAGGDGDGSRDTPRALRRAPRVALLGQYMVSSYPSAGSPGARPCPAPKLQTRPEASSANVCVAPAATSVANAPRERDDRVRTSVPFVRAFARPKKKTASRDAERLVTRRSSSSRCSSSKRPSSSASSRVVVVVRVFVARARRELGARRPQHRVGAARSARAPTLPLPVVSPAEQLAARCDRPAACRATYENAVTTASRFFFFFFVPGRSAGRRLSSPSPSARGHTLGRFPFPAAGKGKVRRARAVRVRVGVRVAQRAREPTRGNARRARARDEKETSSDASASEAPKTPSSSSLPPPSEEALASSSSDPDAHTRTRVGTSLSRSSPRPSAPRLLLPQQKSAPSAATHAPVARRRHGDDAAPRRRSRRRLREALDASHRGVEPGGASAVVLERRDPASACLERARTADTADTAGEKFRRVGARRRARRRRKTATPRAATRPRRRGRDASAGLDPATSGRKRGALTTPRSAARARRRPACCPARADPRRRSPSSTATRPRRRRARASGPPRRRRFEGEKRGERSRRRRPRRGTRTRGATRGVPGTAHRVRFDPGDVPERAETTPVTPRAERARVSGGDRHAPRRAEEHFFIFFSALRGVGVRSSRYVGRHVGRHVVPLVPLRVHDRAPDVHAPLAVDHRGDVLVRDDAGEPRHGGELGEAKQVQPRSVLSLRARGARARGPRGGAARRATARARASPRTRRFPRAPRRRRGTSRGARRGRARPGDAKSSARRARGGPRKTSRSRAPDGA